MLPFDPTAAPTRRSFLRALGASAGAALLAPLAGCTPSNPALQDAASSAPAAGAGSAPAAPAAPAAAGAMRLGVQLYTLREALGRDLEGTLAALSTIGYRNVELFTHHGKTPAELRAMLDRHQLAAPSAHVQIGDLRASSERVLDAAAALGHRWVVVPYLQDTERSADAYRRVAGELSRWGEQARARNIGMAYHNHDFEFAPIAGVAAGTPATGWDILRAEADPTLVKYELDVYWATKAGRDPIPLITQEPGRVVMLHAKDATAAPARTMVDVGTGTIDFARMLREGGPAGVQGVYVEHDNPTDALATARAGFTHLQPLLPT